MGSQMRNQDRSAKGLTSEWTKNPGPCRLGWARSGMLGFVPQPNLPQSSAYHDLIAKGETQQIGKKSFRATTIYPL